MFNYQKGEINFIWSPTYGLLEAGNQLAGSVFPGYSRQQCVPSRKKIVLGPPVAHFDCEAIHGHDPEGSSQGTHVHAIQV
jgi:hypothetical protein